MRKVWEYLQTEEKPDTTLEVPMRCGPIILLYPMRFSGFSKGQSEAAPYLRSCWRRSFPALSQEIEVLFFNPSF